MLAQQQELQMRQKQAQQLEQPQELLEQQLLLFYRKRTKQLQR